MAEHSLTTSVGSVPVGVLGDVVGMWQVKHRLLRSVVAPIEAFAGGDDAVTPPSGVLLHGPPGCGLGFIAQRLAEELAQSTDVHLVADLDEMPRNDPAVAESIFTPTTGAGVRSFVVATTHAPWQVPQWMFGSGRIDRMVFVPPPDRDARRCRLDQLARVRTSAAGLIQRLLDHTSTWTSRDLEAFLADDSVNWAAPDAVIAATLDRPLAIVGWLEQARVMAMFAAERGMLDDLTAQLERYRLA